ncbi:MAG: MBL fold metallo-hydrolase [Clostridia bacterium]|nr:MBL fold metallo-hydrolase [Clostridia bacterium]
MELYNLYPGSFASNCYLLLSNGHAAVVDPSAQAQTILEELQKHHARLDMILLTHGHFDHILSLDELRDLTHTDAYVHEEDIDFPQDATKNAFYSFFRRERVYRRPERPLQDGTVLQLGNERIRVLHTPGHTPGSVCYLCNDEFLVTGDTLFNGSYGRYDLYGGSCLQLRHSLEKLRQLPQELPIYPGHGDSTRLGDALDQISL